jgi:hypothetical protein
LNERIDFAGSAVFDGQVVGVFVGEYAVGSAGFKHLHVGRF